MLPHPPTVSFINKLRSVHFTVCMLYLNKVVCVSHVPLFLKYKQAVGSILQLQK